MSQRQFDAYHEECVLHLMRFWLAHKEFTRTVEGSR